MAICYVTEILRYGSALNNDVILWMSPILTDVATYSCSHYPRSRSSAHAPSSACWMETQVSSWPQHLQCYLQFILLLVSQRFRPPFFTTYSRRNFLGALSHSCCITILMSISSKTNRTCKRYWTAAWASRRSRSSQLMFKLHFLCHGLLQLSE